MSTSVKKRADYPFAESNLEDTLHEVEAFRADPGLNGIERTEVLEFVRLTRQFAFLERLIQGEVRFELPVHLEHLNQDLDSIESQAEAIAARERELLELGLEPAEDLLDALDMRGIKVFRRSRGPESPEVLTGGFHYLGESGPSILVGCCGGSPDAEFVLAHEYGHLVMDVNPYESRFCRWRRHDLENENHSASERRADRFARALLLPEGLVRKSSPDLNLPNPEAGTISHAAEVFGVAPAVLWRRLADLDLPRSEEPPASSKLRRRKVDEQRPTDLPERFVNLALAAYSTRLLEKLDLGRFLRVPHERLDDFLVWSKIPVQVKREDLMPTEEED